MVVCASTVKAGAGRLGRCVLISPLFFTGLAACAGDPPEPGESAPPPDAAQSYTLSTDALGGYAPSRSITGAPVVFSQVLPPAGEDGRVNGDVESQTGAALRLLDAALREAGLSRGDVVHLTVHVVVDEAGGLDAQGVANAWRRNFANAMQPEAPARTLIGVAGLPAPGARISLTALAERPDGDPDESDPTQ